MAADRSLVERFATTEWEKGFRGCRERFSTQQDYINHRLKAAGIDPGAEPSTHSVPGHGAEGEGMPEAVEQAARREWTTNANGCREEFGDEGAFIAYRQAEAQGLIRQTSPA